MTKIIRLPQHALHEFIESSYFPNPVLRAFLVVSLGKPQRDAGLVLIFIITELWQKFRSA
jgi:hypothetical protein